MIHVFLVHRCRQRQAAALLGYVARVGAVP